MNESAPTANQSTAIEEELAQVLDRYLEDVEQGRSPDSERIIAEHPRIADRFRTCLQSLEAVAMAVEGLASSTPGNTPNFRAPKLEDYRILREIGRGGMGVVYEAEQISLARRVA